MEALLTCWAITDREEGTIQYQLMANATIKTLSKFPDIRDDLANINDGAGEVQGRLTFKLRQVRSD